MLFLLTSASSFAAALQDGDIVVLTSYVNGEFDRVDTNTGAYSTLLTTNEFNDLVASLDSNWHVTYIR